jgi:hypothetical protein
MKCVASSPTYFTAIAVLQHCLSPKDQKNLKSILVIRLYGLYHAVDGAKSVYWLRDRTLQRLARRTDSVSFTMLASMSNTSNIFMSPDFLTKFLEVYRESPALWQVRSLDYSNRAKRTRAWDLLVQFTREKISDADLCFVKKRVKSIRASFRKELRRVRDSKRSGSSADDVYKPTLWYFDLLLFTADQENPRKSSFQ